MSRFYTNIMNFGSIKELAMTDYNDQQVVAAFNGCLDLNKWGNLPYDVRQRFLELFCKFRIKPVCFFDQCGFGLRVFLDKGDFKPDGGDEVDVVEPKKGGMPQTIIRMNLDGHWLRCPKELYNKVEFYLVMDNKGRSFYREEEMDEDEEVDSEEYCPVPEKYSWYWSWASRNRATPFPIGDAQLVAQRVGGIVVKKD